MVKLHCPNGHEYKTREFHRAPDETHCAEPGCGARLETGMERNSRKRASRAGGRLREESAAETAARQRFNTLVLEWPCWARKHRPCEVCQGSGFVTGGVDLATGEIEEVTCAACHGDGKHHCTGPKDAHHLVPKDWIREVFGDLPEVDLLDILYDPLIGAPACRYGFHEALEKRKDTIAWHELDDEAKEFYRRIDEKYPGRPSMLERLKLESPVQLQEAADVAEGCGG